MFTRLDFMNLRHEEGGGGGGGGLPTYGARHHALSWHQVVIEALQAAVQGVGDPPLVVVQRGVHGLPTAPQRAPQGLLHRGGNIESNARLYVYCSFMNQKMKL